MTDLPYLSGMIGACYGRPWSHARRLALLPRRRTWGPGGYVDAPKDDLELRAPWREPHDDAELERLVARVDAVAPPGPRDA